MNPDIEAFFDPATFTYSYVVTDPATKKAAIIDAVYDFDPASGTLSTESADRMVEFVERRGLTVDWILDTHVHADHLTAMGYLRERLNARTGIGARVVEVQSIFAERFNAGEALPCDGRQFDALFADCDVLNVGGLEAMVMHTPGHTPACVTYVFDGAAFVGDTIFMPDFGTARTDFPGGDAHALYNSIRGILALSPKTRLYMCHDYGSDTRNEFEFETTVAEQRKSNVHIHDGVSETDFVRSRQCRDRALDAPKLLYPSVQFNMRAGELPPAESNGTHYFKIPLRVA